MKSWKREYICNVFAWQGFGRGEARGVTSVTRRVEEAYLSISICWMAAECHCLFRVVSIISLRFQRKAHPPLILIQHSWQLLKGREVVGGGGVPYHRGLFPCVQDFVQDYVYKDVSKKGKRETRLPLSFPTLQSSIARVIRSFTTMFEINVILMAPERAWYYLHQMKYKVTLWKVSKINTKYLRTLWETLSSNLLCTLLMYN